VTHDIGSADAVCEYGVRDFGSSEGSRRSTGLFSQDGGVNMESGKMMR